MSPTRHAAGLRSHTLVPALVVLLAALQLAGCGRKDVRIDTEPPGAEVSLVQNDAYPEYPEYYGTQYTTPANFRLKQNKHHVVRIRSTDHDTLEQALVRRRLNFWQVITFQWLHRTGNLQPVYRFSLAPTVDQMLRSFAEEYSREISSSMPRGLQSVAIFPYVDHKMESNELGKRFAQHLSFALQRDMGYRPRQLEFSQVRRYLVENDQGLGARALGTGDDLAFYANQLGVDIILVGRVRREGSTPPFYKFETFVIDPQSGATLTTFAKTLTYAANVATSRELERMYAEAEVYVPPPLRQEVKTAANRLAVKLLEGYEIRAGGQRVNVKFADFESAPPYWGKYVREEVERRIVTDSRGLMLPVPEHHEQTDLGFDAGRRQTGRPQLLSDYQLSIVGNAILRDDQVVLTARLRAPNGDVWMIETAEFTLSDPGIQRREWQNPQ
ncbi:MAG: hypothetical protein KF858_08515 [Candidatus Sumerlaeia bacterium]|nr:hypothetical protein [Candidatus Sumerlaeia bacterium]